nr:ORF1 [Lepus torque teno virus 2]QIJ55550.1 ORF1 [Lepus torque teno virus 2]
MRYTRRRFRRRWGRRGAYRRRRWHRRRYARRRARRGRRWRRRKGGRRVRFLFEYMPRFWRRCTIRGWWPVLATGYRPPSNTDNDAAKKMKSLKPWTCFGMAHTRGWFYGDNLVNFGGYAVGTFSLSSLYQEHLMFRNRWSASNCGFDLASYRGTKIYLWPHPQLDYIVYFDPEYRDFDKWLEQCMHPAVMVTHPQTKIIRAIANAGPRRKLQKIFIPPPSTMNSGWSWMKDLATQGLFAWYVSWIDFHNPWFAHVEDPNDIKWWSKGQVNQPPSWQKDWLDLQKMPVGDQVLATYGVNNFTTAPQADWYKNNRFIHLGYGPFIYKNKPNPSVDWGYPQITFFYKSYWQFGGSTTTLKTICDPETVIGMEDFAFTRNFNGLALTKWNIRDVADSIGTASKQPSTQAEWNKWADKQQGRWYGRPHSKWPDLSKFGSSTTELVGTTQKEDLLQKDLKRIRPGGPARYSWDGNDFPQARMKF